jgi:hypothetical protein
MRRELEMRLPQPLTHKSIPFQQQLAGRPFAIVLLRAQSNRLPDLLPLVPRLVQALRNTRPGAVVEVSA